MRHAVIRSLLPRGARALAILPQAPTLTSKDLWIEGRLKLRIERAERATQARVVELSARPKFSSISTVGEVLDSYGAKRGVLRVDDRVAAFYRLGRLAKVSAHASTSPVTVDPRFQIVNDDMLSIAPRLRARQVSNVLQAAAYIQLRNPALLSAVCKRGVHRIDDFGIRDVVSCVYSLGRYSATRDANYK